MINTTTKNPVVVTIPSPVGIDLAVQNALAVLPWLEKSFGRAWMFPQHIGNDKVMMPCVYQGGKEYYCVMPNDSLRGYSFWRVNGARSFDEYVPLSNYNGYEFTDPVDLIVWVNLKQADPTKDYVFTEELIRQVVGILDQDPNCYLKKVWDEKAEDIFKGYSLKDTHRDLLMFPYAAFRIEMELKYVIQC
jgi:hypothetical protein